MLLQRIIRLGVLVAVLVAGSATYALAATQELTATATAAPGEVTASGVAVDHVSYEVDRRDSKRVSAVHLHLAVPSHGTVLTTLDGGTTWLSCAGTGRAFRCPTHGSQLGVQDAAGLSIAPAVWR